MGTCFGPLYPSLNQGHAPEKAGNLYISMQLRSQHIWHQAALPQLGAAPPGAAFLGPRLQAARSQSELGCLMCAIWRR